MVWNSSSSLKKISNNDLKAFLKNCYKVGRNVVTKWDSFLAKKIVTKWDGGCYKVGQLFRYKVGR